MTERSTHRPLGVWILTIADGIFGGIVPLLAVLILNLDPAASPRPLNTYIGVALAAVFLACSICLTAYRAWLGDAQARKVLLVLLTIYWGLIAFNNPELTLSGAAQQLYPESPLRFISPLVRAVFWLAINYLYFLSGRTRTFYAAAKA